MNRKQAHRLLHGFLLTPDLERLDAPAVLTKNSVLTYGQLGKSVAGLANQLAQLGCGSGERVAILLPKSESAIQAILAVWWLGGVAVPLDEKAPEARVRTMLMDAEPRVVVTTRDWQKRLTAEIPDESYTFLTHPWSEEMDGIAGSMPSPDSLALLYYTSGTTGSPKAIMLSHDNVVSFLDWAISTFGLSHSDRFASHAPFHFDLSTLDLYAAFRVGASVFLLDKSARIFPVRFGQILEQAGITILYAVPTALDALAQHGSLSSRDLSCLRWILFAGEVFPMAGLRRLMACLPGKGFANLYGPTETNVCTWHPLTVIPNPEEQAIPIGQPCSHLRVELINEAGQPANEREAGEVVVYGPAVSRGYWRRPELTAATRYLGDPASFRTGDLAWRDAQGDLHFMGRLDDQVKIRGHRVELLEIKSVLESHPAVMEALALLVTEEDGVILTGFVVVQPDGTFEMQELERYCKNHLPSHAVPARLVRLEAFPRTSTGKIDRQSLAKYFLKT